MAAKAKAKTKKPARKAPAKKTPVKKSARKAAQASVGSLVGKAAPAFTMPADDGSTLSLKDLRGKPVVLYFYPKDDTTGCTAEACDFRDRMTAFKGATVIGVSKDSIKSHQKFKAKYSLTFPLASDDSGVCEAYGVWKEKSMYGRKFMGIERSTFIIDKDGKVRAEWRKVSVPGHAEEVKQALRSL
ncbi:MAG: peroxiredoxin [Rhodospirillaceae bacterium]|nr:peroxiredoxin [Rhodospirillaceae bacterium]